MSKQKRVPVEFYIDGELVKQKVDAGTAYAINVYNDIYKNVDTFAIKSETIPGEKRGAIYEEYVAKSPEYTIVCIKKHIPHMPLTACCGPYYSCGVLRNKDKHFDSYVGYIPMLYYKLFRGRTK